MPKVDGSRSTSSESQPGQLTDALTLNISFSNFSSQAVHTYSKTGKGTPSGEHYSNPNTRNSWAIRRTSHPRIAIH
jgi:hypothetical protein